MLHDVPVKAAPARPTASLSQQKHGVISLARAVRLSRGQVHEALGNSADSFALIVAAAAGGPVVWAGMGCDLGSLSPGGGQSFIDPSRLLISEGVTRTDVLFAGEQALRCDGVSCVVMQLEQGPDLKESRRLQLAAEEGGAIGLALINGRAQTSAAHTRWRCNAIYGSRVTWLWTCVKSRKGETGAWRVALCGGGHGWDGGEYGPDLIHMAAATPA